MGQPTPEPAASTPWTLLEAGRTAEAVAAARARLEAARTNGRQPALLSAHRELGRLLLAVGDLDRAESACRNSVQQARVGTDPLELGASLYWLGRVLERTPRLDRALLAFAESIPLLASASSPLVTEARAALERLGAAPGHHR